MVTDKGKIWIDLDNSPHVPFFAPIVEELQKRGYSLVLTARNCFQVHELADLFHLNYKLIGRHSAKEQPSHLADCVLPRVTSDQLVVQMKKVCQLVHLKTVARGEHQ